MIMSDQVSSPASGGGGNAPIALNWVDSTVA